MEVVGMRLNCMAGDAAVARAKRWTEIGLNVRVSRARRLSEGSQKLFET